MRLKTIMAGCLSLSFLSLPLGARALEDLTPLDMKEVDPAMLKDQFGPWQIQDAKGRKRCRVVLKREAMIGGMQIEVASDCAKTFPVMGDITAWRLSEGWAIDLVDALRKTRIRFTTPDERYVAEPETDGIFTIVKLRK